MPSRPLWRHCNWYSPSPTTHELLKRLVTINPNAEHDIKIPVIRIGHKYLVSVHTERCLLRRRVVVTVVPPCSARAGVTWGVVKFTVAILNEAQCGFRWDSCRNLEDDNIIMMTSSNGNIFRVTGPLWVESTGHWWIPLAKASDAGALIFSLIHAWTNGWANNRHARD